MYICACVSTHMLYRGSSGLVLVIWVRMIRNNPGNAWVCPGLQAPITSNDQHSILSDNIWFSLVSRPPLFLFFGLHSVYNTWKQKSGEKWGRPGSIHHMNYVSGCMWGGSRERVAQSKTKHTGSSVQVLYHYSGLQTFAELKLLAYSLSSLVCTYLNIGSSPLCPPCIYSSDDCS